MAIYRALVRHHLIEPKAARKKLIPLLRDMTASTRDCRNIALSDRLLKSDT